MKHINIWDLTAHSFLRLFLVLVVIQYQQTNKKQIITITILSEQISKERLAKMEREAKAEWVQEYGDIPPNLASEQLIYLKVYAKNRSEEMARQERR
ncbi:hypothetical protein [Pasteurella multocida]|uniref:hypothetical protein n=1 Tax=Pasteurella multocida TaxID=747 RepID=UPI00227CC636|nr:hypothetical protein [Pasteurella multocida]WAJ42286.1 hypothetical protein OR605_10620 [Pasteurella multocida]